MNKLPIDRDVLACFGRFNQLQQSCVFVWRPRRLICAR